MNIYFEGGAGGGGAGAGGPASTAPSFTPPFPWYRLVWPDDAPVPESWMAQDISFSEAENARIGIVQRRNGPCGILSVLQAYLVIELHEEAGETGSIDLNAVPSEDAVNGAFCRLLRAAAAAHPAGHKLTLCEWDAAGVPGAIVSQEVDPDMLHAAVDGMYSEGFRAPGGVVLLLYSALLTRGVDLVRQDISADAGEPPLVLPPFHTCTSELVSLLCRGLAGGNTSSYTVEGAKQDWGATPIGLLSTQELEQGVPVADTLKSPPYPVWILHGGDHFTTLFAASRRAPTGDAAGATPFVLHHWNGLAPAGPRLATLRLTAAKGVCGAAPTVHKETFRKAKKGTLDEIVQARDADRTARPGKYATWEYEVSLAVDDPDVGGGSGAKAEEGVAEEEEEGVEADEEVVYGDLEPPVGPWRCATCYHGRFKTMCFGLNEDTEVCRHCGKARREALWSVWRRYEDMSPSMQALATRMFAPKVCRTSSEEDYTFHISHTHTAARRSQHTLARYFHRLR